MLDIKTIDTSPCACAWGIVPMCVSVGGGVCMCVCVCVCVCLSVCL